MSQVFKTLQDRHRDLATRSLKEASAVEFLQDVRTFLSDGRQAGAVVADAGERSQLRSYMRFMATILSDAGQEVPEIGLLPLDRERFPARRPPGNDLAGRPIWFWMLVGAAALVVVAGLVGVVTYSVAAVSMRPTETPEPATSTPPPPTATFTPIPSPTPTIPPTATPLPEIAAFQNLTVALGILSENEPLLVGTQFDWNTETIYAIFDYQGMEYSLDWSVVWEYEGEEVLREDRFGWDVARFGSSGTMWAVYHNEGFVITPGDYTVSAYIEDELQAEVSFNIAVYVPPTP
jgi:hypothetical protein